MRLSTILDTRLSMMEEVMKDQHNKFPNPDKVAKLLNSGNLKALKWPSLWKADSSSMWGSSGASGSRSIPLEEREDFLRTLWPAMGRAYCLAHPWEDACLWQKILDAAVECLRSFEPRSKSARKQAVDSAVLGAAWEAATDTIEAAFEAISKQHSLFRSRRGPKPSLQAIVGHGGVVDKAKERACRMATTELFVAMQKSPRQDDDRSGGKGKGKRESENTRRSDDRGRDPKRPKDKDQLIGRQQREWNKVHSGFCIWDCLSTCKRGSSCKMKHKAPPNFDKAKWLKEA
jgi:hypothetical protein